MSIFANEEEPKRKAVPVLGEELERFSIEELDQRIGLFENEIRRLQEAKLKKQNIRSAAENFFKIG